MAGRDEMIDQNVKKRTITDIRILVIALILLAISILILLSLGTGRLYSYNVSVRQLYDHPSVYTGKKVRTTGYLVKHTIPHFGDTYRLYEGNPRNLYFTVNPSVAVAGTPSTLDLHLSFTYNGTCYDFALSPCSFALPCRLVVSGVFIDRGLVTDASQYVIEASSVEWLAE